MFYKDTVVMTDDGTLAIVVESKEDKVLVKTVEDNLPLVVKANTLRYANLAEMDYFYEDDYADDYNLFEEQQIFLDDEY